MHRQFRRLALASGCALFILVGVSRAASLLTESFTTSTWKDAVNTTALWDTGAGNLRLHPFTMSLVGAYDTPGTANGVAVAGDLAFVADDYSGLKIINITNTASPALVGTYATAGTAMGVAVAGDLAFVADGLSGLEIVNITNPASPSLTGSYNTPGFAYSVAVAGDLVFVADYYSGLLILNITTPTNPTFVANFSAPTAYGITVAGDLAFLADYDNGLKIINIKDPVSPALVGTYDTPGQALGVVVAGDLAFVADYDEGLQIINITNPAGPTLTGTYNTPGFAYSVAVSGNLAFVADYADGLHAIDITNPASPTLVNTYDTPSRAVGVVVAGDLAFVADYFSGLEIIRHSDPVPSPVLVSTYNTPGYAENITVAGDLAFVSDGFAGVQIINITNPASPTLVGSYDTPDYAKDVAVAGDLMFVADFDAGLQIINITNPASPTLVGNYNTPGQAQGVAVAGDLAFVADIFSGLQIINISDPASPTFVGSYDTPGYAYEVAVAGDLAFVADLTALYILNITNPSSPTLVGSFAGAVSDVEVAGDLAFTTPGLKAINIANPASPTLVGSFATSGGATGLAVAGDLIFLAEEDVFVDDDLAILQIVDISNPSSPALFGAFDNPGVHRLGVAVSGDLVFSANGNDGIQIIQAYQREVRANQNIGRSLSVDGNADVILRARLSSTQTAGVSWEVSANAGTNWQDITPNNTWLKFATTGSDLQWRSKHTWVPGLNPTVSDLQLEWLNTFGKVAAVTDVPGDQGGRVYVDWTRSGYDFEDQLTTPVTGYNLYRRVDNMAMVSAVEDNISVQTSDELTTPSGETAFPLPGARTVTMGRQVYVIGSEAADAALFPPGTWALVGTAFATQTDTYRAEATTGADSSTSGNHDSVYLVTTHTTTPSIWFISPTASGHSVDNIAPAVPANVTIAYNGAGGNTLSWGASPDADFQYFRVYRSTNPNFTPSPGTLVRSTITTGWVDPNYHSGGVYYKLTATDFAGNESGPASPGTITGVGGPAVPKTFALYPNVPNPFNPTTLIRYDVPENGGDVSLRIYDVGGRVVKTLVSGAQSAGAKSLTWDGRDDAGQAVSSGVYFYKLVANSFSQTNKMVLLK